MSAHNPSEQSEEHCQLTSYWLGQQPDAFLYHLKDISARMDPADPKHAQLRSHIKTYLQFAEQVEGKLEDRVEKAEEGVEELQKKVEELDKETQVLTAKLLQAKLADIAATEKRAQMDEAFLAYVESVYNPLIRSLTEFLNTGDNYSHLNSRPSLQLCQLNEEKSTKAARTILQSNRNKMTEWIEDLKKRNEELAAEKARLTKQITGFLGSSISKDSLFLNASKSFEATSKVLQKITEGEKQVGELEAKIGELQQVHSRKLAKIAAYRHSSKLIEKATFSNDENLSTESSSSEREFQRTDSQTVTVNTQVIVHQQKPHPYLHRLLAVWFALLAAGTMWMVFA